MLELRRFPPNIEEIRKVFPLTGEEIFAYGNTIYNPSGITLSPELQAHEEVHAKQQAFDPRGWWDRYLIDPQFRLEQELEAHQVEYRTFCRNHKDRNLRNRYLMAIAKRLSGPVYGSIVSQKEARKLIRN